MHGFQQDLPTTPQRDRSEHHIEAVQAQGGIFVEAVRVTRMPMIATDATLPGNPITFANDAFLRLSGYSMEEVLGQEPHFMNGPDTDLEALRQLQGVIAEGREATLELVQYRKDGSPFRAHLLASPLSDGQGRVTSLFCSYLDITRRHDAEEDLQRLTAELEHRVIVRTQELAAANKRLSRLVAEKEMLLVEVNHRAKNSLNVASALLAVQGRRQPDPTVRALFQEAEARLHAMARAHDLLSKSDDPRQVALSTYLRDLCSSLAAGADSDARIRFDVEADEGIHIEANKAIPLGLVVAELITNAVKYAFPVPRAGTIQVRAHRPEPSRVELSIRDDGVGMSTLREGSLGYGIIRSLVEQIDGDITVQGDAGVAVTLTFPG
jgi:PAS domain S-box-containing protein